MRGGFWRLCAWGGSVGLLLVAAPETGYAQAKIEDQIGRSLAEWRKIGDFNFVTVKKMPRRCEVVIRVRKKGTARNPWLELWQAKKVITSEGDAAAESPYQGRSPGPATRPMPPRPDYRPSSRLFGSGSLQGPSADDTGEVRLDRWKDLFEGQTWAVQLPEDVFVGFILRTNQRDKAVKDEAHAGYHTLSYQSGWAFDVWIVKEEQ